MKNTTPNTIHHLAFGLLIYSLNTQAQQAIADAEGPPLETIIVTASKVESSLERAATSVTIITKEEIALRGYNSLLDTLRTQPGIAASNSGGLGSISTLRVRGEEGYRTRVLMDGVDISDVSGTQVGPQMQHLMTGSDIERVEILRGPQGFMYGADAGGVINILTQSGNSELGGDFRIEGGQFNTVNTGASLAAGSDKADVFVSANALKTDGFNAAVTDLENEEDGYDNISLHSKFGWNIQPQLRAQAVLRHVDAENEYDGCFTNNGSSNDCANDFSQTLGKVSLDFNNERQSHGVSLSYSDVERDNNAAGDSTFSTQGNMQTLEYLGSLKTSERLKFVFGGDYQAQNLSPKGQAEMERDQKGVFTEIQTTWFDALYINAGARYDDNSDFGNHTSVRLSAAYIQTLAGGSTLKYRSAYGTGFRAPSLSEIAYNASPSAYGAAAATSLKEEQSSGYDLGIDYRHPSGLNAQATYFNQLIGDEIYFDLIDFSGYLQSDGESSSEGIELAVAAPLNNRFTLLGNYTYNTTENSEQEQRARRPEHLFNAGLQAATLQNKLHLLANLRASSGAVNDIYGLGRVELDDYRVFDISARYAINTHFTVSLRAENISDAEYQEVTGYNTAGRSIYAGVNYTF